LQAENARATSPIHSYIAVALSWQGRIFGLFEVDSFQTNAFNPADLSLMEKVATALSGPIELAQRYATEVKAVAQAEEARQRLNFLAQASEALASSLDYETTLAAVVNLAVPYLADWCSLDIEDTSGVVKRVATAHPVPAKQKLAHRLLELFPYTPEQFDRLKSLLRTGQALFAGNVGEAYLRSIARSEAHYDALKELNLKSTMLVPLIARGQLVGAFTLAITERERYYTEADLSLAEELARRSATAIDNARLYQEAQKVIEAQKELDQLKDQFLSIASHELRTPLTSIKGYAQLLEKLFNTHRSLYRPTPSAPEPSGSPPDSNAGASQSQTVSNKLNEDIERSLRIVAHIQQQSNRMNELIREMLDVSRIQNGRLELIYKPGVDLVKLVQRVIEQQSFSESHLLSLQTTRQVIPATVDEGRVEQVLTNLISNALKYSQAGSEIVIGVELSSLEKKKAGSKGGKSKGKNS
jgi:GAF domain-containing protein